MKNKLFVIVSLLIAFPVLVTALLPYSFENSTEFKQLLSTWTSNFGQLKGTLEYACTNAYRTFNSTVPFQPIFVESSTPTSHLMVCKNNGGTLPFWATSVSKTNPPIPLWSVYFAPNGVVFPLP